MKTVSCAGGVLLVSVIRCECWSEGHSVLLYQWTESEGKWECYWLWLTSCFM